MDIAAVRVCFLISLLFPVNRGYVNPWSLPVVPQVPLYHTSGGGGVSKQQHALESPRVSTKLESSLSKPWHQALPVLCLWCWKPPDRRCAGWLMSWTDPRAKKRERKEEQGAVWLCHSRSCDHSPGMFQTGHPFTSKTWTKIGQHPAEAVRKTTSCQPISWPERKANGPLKEMNCFPSLASLQTPRPST